MDPRILGEIYDHKEEHEDPGPFQNLQYKLSIPDPRPATRCLCPPSQLWQQAVPVRYPIDVPLIDLVSQLVPSLLSRQWDSVSQPCCLQLFVSSFVLLYLHLRGLHVPSLPSIPIQHPQASLALSHQT
jgi:hypothetical protein